MPIDVSRASLFDTAYVHPWLRNSSLLWKYYDLYLRWILWVSWGTTHGFDQWIGGKPDGWTAAESEFYSRLLCCSDFLGVFTPFLNKKFFSFRVDIQFLGGRQLTCLLFSAPN